MSFRILTEAAPPSQDPPALKAGEVRAVASLAALLAVVSLAWCYTHGLLLLYGDAVAHLHIARRIFDSRNPGFRQLGSVWLPLSHLLLVPFVQKMSWWQNGLAGAWPSVACYVAACAALYRLARCWLTPYCAAIAAAFFGLNPGLLYFATTAMTEPLFLLEMIAAALLLAMVAESNRMGSADKRVSRLLLTLGLVLVCAVFTRYDGWIYAALAWLIATIGLLGQRRRLTDRVAGTWILFTVMVAMAPLLWIGYNERQFHDPLDFLRGPYSARAIEARTTPSGSFHYPGYHNMGEAALYFMKAAELGAVVRYGTQLLFLLTVAGTVAAVHRFRTRRLAPALLLWFPLPFYAYSVAYGSVPIFIPNWFPHAWYNTRYGMEMLPAFALFLAFFVDALARRWPAQRSPIVLLAALLIVANAGWLLRSGPLVFAEGVANSRTRIPFERALAKALKQIPPEEPILMYTSDHIGAVQAAGIPLRRTINEGDYLEWQAALGDPAKAAPFLVAVDGDPLARTLAQRPSAGLEVVSVVCSTGQPCARVYRSVHSTGR